MIRWFSILLLVSSASALTVDVSQPPYNAACDGKTDDTAADQAAVNAVCTAGGGTVLIPGMSAATGLSTPAGFQGHLAIVGTSEASGFALLDNVGYFLDFELQAGANNGALNVGEVRNLRFESNGHAGAAAVKIAYGVIPSSEANTGSIIEDLTIQGGGWTNGVLLLNCWHVRAAHIYGYGSAATYDSGSGAGSGALLAFSGQCVNETVVQLQTDFFRSAVSAVALAGTTFQGFQIAQVNAVQAPSAILLDGSAGTSCGAVQITNLQVDNGNNQNQSHGWGVTATDCDDIGISNFWSCDASAAPNALFFKGCDLVEIGNGEVVGGGPNGIIGISTVDCGTVRVHDLTFAGWTTDVSFDAKTSGSLSRNNLQEGGGPALVDDLGSGDTVGDALSLSTVVTLKGGQAVESFPPTVEGAGIPGKPNAIAVSDASDTVYSAKYNWDTGMIDVWNPRGPTSAGNGVRLNEVVAP